MAFAKVYTVAQTHLRSEVITVEADVSKGLHHFSIVGLADRMVDESKERCSLAIKHSKFRSPRQSNEKILISLAPAHIRKIGTSFDVAISVSYLLASKQIGCDVSGRVFLGELSLNGEIRRIKGVIPMIQKAITEGFSEVCIPAGNVAEASILSEHISIIPCESLSELIGHLCDFKKIERVPKTIQVERMDSGGPEVLFDHIKGNELAKRALLIAMCGGHNICLYGPPGTGKTMLARASARVMPKLSFEQQVELTSIYSLSSEYSFSVHTHPPFRAPHHSASYASIVGGGRDISPGEITLSHFGILFLDEFPEFDRRVIDSLRQPLEERRVRIARTGQKIEFPCDFQLVCSMNPCPCGYLNTGIKECVCSIGQIQKYDKKVSGPIIDRVEMWVEVSKVAYEKLMRNEQDAHEQHDTIVNIVKRVRDKQILETGALYGKLGTKRLLEHMPLSMEVKEFYDVVARQLQISARSYTNTLKVALTIMLIEQQNQILKEHILEALSYRPKERISG